MYHTSLYVWKSWDYLGAPIREVRSGERMSSCRRSKVDVDVEHTCTAVLPGNGSLDIAANSITQPVQHFVSAVLPLAL